MINTNWLPHIFNHRGIPQLYYGTEIMMGGQKSMGDVISGVISGGCLMIPGMPLPWKEEQHRKTKLFNI